MENVVINNKSDKPDNIVAKTNQIIEECLQIQKELPKFMTDFFIFIRGSVEPSTRRAYLQDIRFFCEYLVEDQMHTEAKQCKDITLDDFKTLKAKDINLFLGEYCLNYKKRINANTVMVFQNDNRALARKKSSLTTLFKFLYRNEQLEKNITDGFNSIKLPKVQPDNIKRLEIDEVAIMLEAVENGVGLTEREKRYWKKTRLRDKAILVLFVTYGLRLSECATCC